MMDDLRIIDTGEFKTHESFHDYNTSVDALSIPDQAIAGMKFKHFFRYVRESFIKHFVIWLDELFFLSLFSCHQTATCVAQLLNGNRNGTNNDCEFVCNIHKRTININRFRNFLDANVKQDTIMRTRNLPILQLHPIAMQFISNGADIWHDDQSNRALVNFRQLYLEQYSAFPTKTQFVETEILHVA